MNKIAPRQIYFYLAAIAPVGKLLLMPVQLAEYAKNDLLFSAAANFLLQAGIIFLVMLLSRSNRSLYELLTFSFGKIAAKIVTCIFSLFLLFAAFLPLLEQELFVQSVFYDTLPSIVAYSPFFLFSAYLCSKPLFNMGRAWDILAPIAIAGYVGIMILSFSSADFSALLPVGGAGITGILKGTAFTVSWFFDSALLLLFMGKFEYKKGMAWKSVVFYLLGAVAFLFFLAAFYGVYSDIAVRQYFAFAKISKYFSGITVLGRIDYLFIFALALVMAFYCSLPIQGCVDCLVQSFGRTKLSPTLFSIGANAILLALVITLEYRFVSVFDTITKTIAWIFPVFCVALPALALLLRRKPREKIR